MVVQVQRSHINRNIIENEWNEMHIDVERQRNGLPPTATDNSCDIDQTLPAYHEIYNDANRSLPAYHEIYNNVNRAFDETSLPPYETAVNWPVQREEISIPIPEPSHSTPQDQPQVQSNCCGPMKHIVIAATVIIVSIVAVFLIIFLIQFR